MSQKIEDELKNIIKILEEWKVISKIEYSKSFMRSDGIPMLYIKAKTNKYYIHIEGIIKDKELKCYIKLTKSNKNKHGHKDEIIGWDNLYEETPHIHFNEDTRREYRKEKITWDEIMKKIEEQEE